jgi:Golgi phosphoprotein 3 (GPP34)
VTSLALQDDLYLHAHDESGKMLTHRTTIDIGLAGAALIQLWLLSRIELIDGLVIVGHPQPTGDPLCDRFLEAILCLSNAHERVRDRLVQLGVLTQVTTRRLGLVAKTRYDVADRSVVIRAHGRTRYAVLGLEQPDLQTMALCSLIGVLRLEGGLYVNRSAGEVLNRLEAIGRSCPPPVREFVAAVDAAAASASVSMYR